MGNTTRRVPADRRVARRVTVLFSAILTRKGWRSQIVEVLDLSTAGARIQLRFQQSVGTEMTLKMPGPRRKLSVPCVVTNAAEEHGHPTAGLRFHVTDDIRAELQEIVERVDAHRAEQERGQLPERAPAPGTPGAEKTTKRVTRRSKRRPTRHHGTADA